MPRDLFAYTDLPLTSKAHRRRLIMMPADTDVLRPTGEPEWGENPTGTNNFFRLLDGAITLAEPDEPQAKFEKWPIGYALAGTLGLLIDHRKLYRNSVGTPATEAQDFSAYLKGYVLAAGGSYLISGTGGGAVYRTFDTSNVFWLKTDDGDATKTISEFRTVFIGVERVLPEKPASITIGVGSRQTVKLFDISRAVMDAVSMQDVCAAVVDWADFEEKDRVIDQAWLDSGELFEWTIKPPDGITLRMYKFARLFERLEALCRRALFSYLRRDISDAGDLADVTFSLSTASHPSSAGSPWDHWTRYAQSGLATTSRGSAVDRADWAIIGEVMLASVRIGGLFEPKAAEEGFARADYSVWEFLTEATKAGVAKAKTLVAGWGVIIVEILKPYESVNIRTIARADLRYPDPSKRITIEITEGFGLVANVSVAVDGAKGDDLANAETKLAQTSRSEQGGTSVTMFDTNPVIDAAENWVDASAHTSHLHQAQNHARIPLRKIYHKTDLGILPSEEYVRLHESSTFDRGDATSFDAITTSTLPITLPAGPGLYASWLLQYRDIVMVTLKTMARNNGPAQMMGQILIGLFGNLKMTKYPLMLRAEIAQAGDIGDEYRIGPVDGSGHYTAQPLVNTVEDDRSDLYGRCWLVSTKIDRDDRVADVELLGLKY